MEKSEKQKPRSSYGSIYYRKDRGKWDVRIPTGERNASGRPVYRHHYTKTKKDAEKLLRKLQRARERGELVVRPARAPEPEEARTDVCTVLMAIDEYLATKKAEGRTEKTLQTYRSYRKIFADHSIGAMPVEDVSPADVEAFMAWRRERVYRTQRRPGSRCTDAPLVVEKEGGTASNATINRNLALLSGAFSRLVDHRRLPENPVSRVKRPKEAEGTRVALSKAEAADLVDACDEFLRPLVIGALFTGARKGELESLTWGDVDLDERALLLRRSKVGNSSRIRIHPGLEAELRALRKRTAAGAGIPADDEPVFLSSKGTDRWDVRRAWTRAVKAAGLAEKRGLTFHSLRHTFAVHFLEGGAAITDLQAILGHARLTTTQVYAKMVDARMNASIEALSYGFEDAGDGEERTVKRIG